MNTLYIVFGGGGGGGGGSMIVLYSLFGRWIGLMDNVHIEHQNGQMEYKSYVHNEKDEIIDLIMQVLLFILSIICVCPVQKNNAIRCGFISPICCCH